jgi:hypothetical protein
MIYITRIKKVKFDSLAHMNNFLKYMFSQSLKHTVNDKTKFNYWQDTEEGGFMTEPEETLKQLKKKHNKRLNFDKLANDLSYINFILEINGQLYSNFIEFNGEEIVMDLPETIEQYIVDDYHGGDPEAFQRYLNKYIQRKTNDGQRSILRYQDLEDIEVRREIEKINLTALNENHPEKIIVEAIHWDQEDGNGYLHVHRLIEAN